MATTCLTFNKEIKNVSIDTEYIYDRDKKRIVKKEDAGSNKKTSAMKMSDLQKKLVAETLEQDLHNLLSFSEDESNVINANEVKKNKNEQEATSNLIGYMQKVADMQGRIDAAYNVGAIDKSTRNRMLNDYLKPVSDYIESNVEQLDEKNFKFVGSKLGYDKIKSEFNTEGLKGRELQDMQRQKLFAQNYYLDELNKAAKQSGLSNIYSIESLTYNQQKELYKNASDNALKRAKRWTDKPELFFAKEYPDIYAQPFLAFKRDEALAINRIVAESLYKKEFENIDGTSKLDLKEYAKMKSFEEIKKQATMR